VILVSGFNVYPNEVEDVIAQLDSVLEVAVIGLPDAKTDEAVCAFVVANPEHPSPPTSEQITAHCRQQLASYKVPKTVTLKDQLPKTPIGKVLRRALREEAI
jgi:long-chain acyl-CoA synthetase